MLLLGACFPTAFQLNRALNPTPSTVSHFRPSQPTKNLAFNSGPGPLPLSSLFVRGVCRPLKHSQRVTGLPAEVNGAVRGKWSSSYCGSTPGSQMYTENSLIFDKVVHISNPGTLGLREEDHELGHKSKTYEQRNN